MRKKFYTFLGHFSTQITRSRLSRHPLNLQTGNEGLVRQIINIHDKQGRLTAQEHYGCMGKKAYNLSWRYNEQGQLTEAVDPLGNWTYKNYDENGNLSSEK